MLRYLPIVFVFLVVAMASAEDKKATTSPTAKLELLKKEQVAAETDYFKAVEILPDTSEGQKKAGELWQVYDKQQGERFGAAVEIAKTDPKSDLAFDALEWVLTIPRSYYLPAGMPAMELVAKHHAANPRVGKIVAKLGMLGPREQGNPKEYASALSIFKAVIEKNPERPVRGQAQWALAFHAFCRFAVAEYEQSSDVDMYAADAVKAYQVIAQDYGDCPWQGQSGSRSLGGIAKSALYELRNLRIGMVVPDIVGEGVDGTKFKLSDQRGKVVVVVFWATWCGPCMSMVPQERKMVERMAGKPFALVGVNGDASREKAKETMAREKMNWLSFWDGPKDGGGPISRQWNVSSWPTTYVIDHRGIIRAKTLPPAELNEMVNAWVKEVPAGKK